MKQLIVRLVRALIGFVYKNYKAILIFIVIMACIAVSVLVLSTKKNPYDAKLAREQFNTKNKIVNDVTELNPVSVIDIIVPHTEQEIVEAVKTHSRVSIGGGRNSMGGQTASESAVQIDMREYNKIISLATSTKQITVQTGASWRDIQDYIDPHGLSVKIMQTYSNFTVGGSLSVNVHGRYVGLGPIILSVKNIKVVLADGTVVTASPTKNSDVFYSAIGGYGGIGVITEATLELTDNINVERNRVILPISTYAEYFKNNISKEGSEVVFHNGDIFPMDFDTVSAVSWVKTDKAPTTESKLIPRKKDYWLERFIWVTMSEWPGGRWLREYIVEPFVYYGKKPVHTKNYEASYDILELEPESRAKSTYVLQEYFVPIENFDIWIPKMKKVFVDNDVNLLNVSIRHALPDPGSKLAWAKKESFAFVVYYKQGTDENSKEQVSKWTKQMIDEVLSVDGGYYLPYQPQATDEQFYRAYPKAIEYFELKKQYDPTNKFTNKLWDKYYSDQKIEKLKEWNTKNSIASTTKEYYRSADNMYLSIPEWYIVYSAVEYSKILTTGMPSDFSYKQAIQDYWKQYRQVITLTKDSYHNTSDYKTVLLVIGVSFSVENGIKFVYENTLGTLSEILANNTQVPEDKIAAEAAREYATFLYYYPWYDFPYINYLNKLWFNQPTQENNFTFGQKVRRVERKTLLTTEFAVKYMYAKAIAYATHTKFGVQDDVIYATVLYNNKQQIIQAAHYQPFTDSLLEFFKRADLEKSQVAVQNIAGNESVTLTYITNKVHSVPDYTELVLSDKEIGGTRYTVLVDTKDLFRLYKDLVKEGIAIEHVYDY